MQKFYLAKLSAFVMAVLMLLTFSACQLKDSNEEESEGSRYDGPAAALEFEIERTMDPSIGKVPWEKLRIAKEQTLASSRNPNRLTSLTWEERGPNGDFSIGGNSRPNQDQTAGRMRALMIDSLDANHKTVFAGSVAGGLWKTTDITVSPANWTPIGDLTFNNLSIAAICQDPRTGFQNNMYLCTGESYGNADAVQGVGVFKSTDGGATWNFLSSTSSYVSGTRIVCDNQGNVYLGTRGNGLLRSTDGGSTWTNITPGGFTRIADLKISSTGRLHVTFGIFSGGGYRFTDTPGTATSSTGWMSATTPFTFFSQRTEFAVSGNTLYALPCDASYQVPTIWKSTDGGDTWVATTGQPNANWASGQGWYALSVAIHPTNPDICIVGGLDCHKTLDGGATWTKISTWASTSGQYVHADQHNIQWWDQGFKLLFACDGGVHFSADAGNTIRDRNKGLRVKQFYGISIHPTLPNYFIAGAQDNGVHRMNHVGLDSSAEVAGGDGCLTAIDQDEPQYQFGSYVYNVFRKSVNNGQTWTSFTLSSSIGRFVNPWDYDNTANKIYSCYSAGSYVRWDNPQTGTTTNVVSITDFASQTVSSVNVSPNTANRVFFGTGNGRVVRVDNADQATPTSANITPTGAAGYVNCVTMGSTDDHLMAIYSNYGVNNIWVSHDAGATWTACDGNLPDMPVRWALFSPNGDDKAFIATETGVWETDLLNGASTVWSANPTFPNVRVDMIKYRASDRTIAAGTHGRGIWTATVPLPYGFSFNNPAPAVATCPAPASMSITLGTTSAGGFTGPIALTATGNPAGTTVSFSPSPVNGGASTTVTLNGTATLAPGTYVITVTGTSSGVTTQTRNLTYTINTGTGPTISSQPSNQTVCIGSAASFSITSNGTSYQWQQSTDGGTTWASISGATSATYNIASAVASANGYQYRCITYNQCTSTTSTVGVLTVNPNLSLTTQPADATACAGVSTSFTVVAAGATGYQWQQSTDGGANWSAIAGATTATYTILSPTVSMSGYKYRCVATGTCTPFTVTSNAATLTVVSSLSITTQPSSVTTCEGTAASFTVVAVGASSYQWQLSTDGGTTFANVTGATSATYTIASPTAAQNGYKYRCNLSSSCGAATTNVVTLTVNTLPAITAQPQSTSICAGSNNTFSVTATGTGITYQWQLSTTGCAGTFTNITGATSSTYVVTAATASQNGYAYKCVVSGTCTPAVTSSCAVLTVIVPTTVTTSPSNVTICDGGNTSFTVVGTGAGIIYQWQVNTGSGFVNVTDGGVYSGATTATLTLTGVNTSYNNYQYRCQLSNAICTTPAVSSLATLTVNSLPAITTSPVSQTVCSASNVTFTAAATGTGISYQWQVNNGTGFANITNGGVYSGATTNTLVITGTTVSLNSYQYRCVVSGTCTPAATTAAATLTVHNPVVIATNPANKEVCAGIDATFNAAGLSVPAVIYQWQYSTNGGTSWSAVTGATSPSYTAVAPGVSASGTLYRCLLSSATCPTTAATTNALLTVRVVPAVGLTASPLTALLPGQSTVLTATPATSTGGTVATTWTQNGTAFTNTANTYTVTVNNLGTYQVGIRETWPSGLYCASLSPAVTISATASSNLFIYPSPNDGNFTVSYYNSTGVSTSRQIAVFDAKGSRVFFKTFSVSGPYTLIPVDLTRASRGNYFVVVADAAGNKLIEGKVSIAK
jgi:hypothetical protein